MADEENGKVSEESLKVEFQEQCFLLSFIDVLIKEKITRESQLRIRGEKKLPTAANNATLLLDGHPFNFMNKLTQYPNQQLFFNMETKDIAHLQPMIRLFKVVDDPDSSSGEIEQEITFDSYLTPDDMKHFMKNKSSRGFGVGIQNFSFAFEGQDPFAVQRSITATLTLFANTFEELLRVREAPDGSEYKYVDLALKTGKGATADLSGKDNSQNADVVSENLDKLNFRLKAVVGWAIPGGSTASFGTEDPSNGIKRTDLLDAINDSFITLNLTPSVHEWKIDEYGRIQFKIKYLAYGQTFFKHTRFNIFSNPEVTANIVERQLQLKYWGDSCKPDEVNDLKENLQVDNQIIADKEKSLQTLVENLLGKDEESSKIYYIPFKSDEMAQFNSKAQYFKFEDTGIQEQIETLRAQITSDINAGTDAAAEAAEGELSKKTVGDLEEETPIGFVFVSDLFDVILKGIDDSLKGGLAKELAKKDLGELGGNLQEEKAKIAKFHKEFQKFRLLLGPVEIRQLKATDSNKNLAVNFGDIPVSLKYFIEWLTKQLLQEDESIYPLARFANDFFTDFIKEFLNNDNCFDGTVKQRVRVGEGSLTSYHGDAGTDEVTEAIKAYGRGVRLNVQDVPGGALPVLNISGDRGNPVPNPGREFENNYLVYYAARVQPPELMRGDRASDEDRGIFHYGIGRDRGLVKTINFSATGPPTLQAVRWEQEGYDGLQQLMSIYNVNIKSYSNVNAFPGVYIYVEPRSISPNTEFDLTKFGLGGYCQIIRSEHSFGPGHADSTIAARWVAPIYSEGMVLRDEEGKTTTEPDVDAETSESPAKCFADPQVIEAAESTGASTLSRLAGMTGKISGRVDNVGSPDDG